MNKIKLSPQYIKLLIFIGMVAVVILPFLFVIKPTLAKSKELDAKKAELEESIAYLNDLKSKYDLVSAEMEEIKADKERIVSQYPIGLRQSNTIAFLMDAEEKFGLPVKAESFESYTESVITEGTVGADGEKTGDLTALSTFVTVSFEGDYTALKNLLNYLNTNKDKMTLYEVNMDYDDTTGLVGGDFKLYQYAFTSKERGNLKKPAVPGLERGTNSLFDPNYVENIPTEAEETETEE